MGRVGGVVSKMASPCPMSPSLTFEDRGKDDIGNFSRTIGTI